ncbi:MAG: MotA/TolQ/ExbB proton channel family protein [Elusimicrobia bacterium]|nr:MotA/TolQ/ExbB proton channel family protein [Elusimicrobiota bacterium]
MFGKVWEMIVAGGAVMWPIIVVSLIIWTLIIEKYFSLKKEIANPDGFTDTIIAFLKNKKEKSALNFCLNFHDAVLPSAVRLLLLEKEKGKEHLSKLMRQIFHETYPLLEKNLSTIAVLAKVAPLLGLLGTVTGMVSTFTSISMYGTSDPQALAKGISQALITTQAGLIVAIPALFFHNYMVRKTDDVMNTTEKNLMKIINFLKEVR